MASIAPAASSRRRAQHTQPPPQQPPQPQLSDSDYDDDFHAAAADATDAGDDDGDGGQEEDRFPARYGDARSISISTSMPIPTGAGQLARAVAQAAINARAVARDKRRRAKREEQRMMQRLREAGLAGEEADAATIARGVPRATPLFGDDIDEAAFGAQAQQQLTAVAAAIAAAAALPAAAGAAAAAAPSFPAPTTRRGGGGGRSPRRGRSHMDLQAHHHSDVEFASGGSDTEDAPSTAAAAPRVDAEVEQINTMMGKRDDEYKEAAVATAVPSGELDDTAAAAVERSEEEKEASDADAAPSALPSMSEEDGEDELAMDDELHRDGDSAAMEAALAAGVSSKLHSLGKSRHSAATSSSISVSTAGLTSSIAHSLRGRARKKSIAVQAHAAGIHGVGRMSRIGSGTSSSGNKPTSNVAAAFLAPTTGARNTNRRRRGGAAAAIAAPPMRDDASSSSASLSSLLHGSAHGRYQLSEEERKISAYYATIQNAATKVSASLDALLPEVGGAGAGARAVEQDPEALAALWTKQGASPDEIRIRLEHRFAAATAAAGSSPGFGPTNADASAPSNEHDAYRKTFSKLTALLNSLSTASLTAVGRGGVDFARSNLNATEQSFREFQEEQEAATALARRQKEEAVAAAAAAAAAAAQDTGAGAGAAADPKSATDSELDSADSSDSEDEEALLAATLRGESTRRASQFKKARKKQHNRRASVSMLDVVVPGASPDAAAAAATATPSSPPAVTLANSLGSPVVAGSVSTPSSFGADVLASVGGFAGALQLSGGVASPTSPSSGSASASASASAAASAAPVDHSAASVYRDLHSFFLGKRRSELIDSKRLHLLETQAALVEEAGESSRAVVNQVMQFRAQKTDQVLSNYHRHLLSTAGQLGKMMLVPPPPAVEWGADGESDAAKASAAAALAAKQRAAGGGSSSTVDEASQRLKLELVVAMLQARVAEQDELLASIGVAGPASPASGAAASSSLDPAAASKLSVQYTYDSNPHLSRSFEIKSARLLSIVSSLAQQLKSRQEQRHRMQQEVDRQRDAIARLLSFEDQAAMDAKMAAEAAAKDAELAARHALASAEIRAKTAAAEAKFQEVARRNHAMTLTLTSVESELGALHALREAESNKIATLRAKHKKDCVQIMRGVVPKHLRALMSKTAQHKEVMHYQPSSGTGAGAGSDEKDSAAGALNSGFEDPESMRTQLALQDDEVRKDLELREAMTLADWEEAEAREAARKEAERNPPPNPPTAEEIAAAEALRLEAEAAAALAAERALTPFSSCRLRLERLYAEVGSAEMVYIPWQEELYLTLQPQVNRLLEEVGELQSRRKIKAEMRREWEEKVAALAAQEAARLAEEAARKLREAEEADADSVDSDPEGEEGDSELKHDSATLAALAAAQGGKIKLIKPKSYPKRATAKVKSYLANGPHSPRKAGSKSRRSSTGLALDGEEEDEITSARFLSMGNNEYVKSSIGSFKLSKTLSNSALQQHILALKAETAGLSQTITDLMAKWTELADTDARVTKLEVTQIAPTRKRITVVRAHLARIEAAIEAKVKWVAQREEAQRAREVEMKELEAKLRQAEREQQENEVARRAAERLAKQAELLAGSDQIPEPSSPPPPPSQNEAVPVGSPKSTPLKTRSRRPSIHGSPGLAAASGEGFAAPTAASTAASRERSRRPSVSLTPNLAPATTSGARPASHHGRTHSRTPSSMGRSAAGGSKHRRSLKKEEMAELALHAASASAAAGTAAASPSSPHHRSPTALRLEVVVPSGDESPVIMLSDAPKIAATADVTAAAADAATAEQSAQLAERNARLLEETAALERELAQLELEQEALEFEQQTAETSEEASLQPSPLADAQDDLNSSGAEPVAPMQWGSSLSSRIAPPSSLKVATSGHSKTTSKGTTPARGRTPTTGRSSDRNSKTASAAQSRRPSIPAASAPLTPLQQSSLLFVSPSLAEPVEGDAATMVAAAAAVEYENSKQLLGAYEQLKLDMARWKEEARIKAEKAGMALPTVKPHTTLETIEAEQDAVAESDGASVADPSSSLASLSKPEGPLPASAPRWAPGPAIVALSLPPEVHAPAPIVHALPPQLKPAATAAAAAAVSTQSAQPKESAAASSTLATGAKKAVRTVNLGLFASVPVVVPASSAVLAPNKLSVAPKLSAAGKQPKDSAGLTSAESDEDAAEEFAPSQDAASSHTAPARVVDMSLPSMLSESDSMLSAGPVRSPQKVLRSVDHIATSGSNVLGSPGHQTRQAALGGAMADYSNATPVDHANASEFLDPPQAGIQRRRAAAGSRIGAAEQRLQDLPPFSAHAMSIPLVAPADVATSARRSIAHPGSPSPIKATKGRRRSGETAGEPAAGSAAHDEATPAAATATVAELLSFASTKPLAPRHPGLTSKRSSLGSTAHVELPLAQELAPPEAAAPTDADTSASLTTPAGVEAALTITPAARLKVQSIDPVQSLPHEASLSTRARRGSGIDAAEQSLSASSSSGAPEEVDSQARASKRSSLEVARETALVLGGAVGSPAGGALSVTGSSKPVMGGGLNLASLLPHQSASAGTGSQQQQAQQQVASAKQAPVLFVSAVSKPIQPKPPATLSKQALLRSGSQPLVVAATADAVDATAAEKVAEAVAPSLSSHEETFVLSSQPDAAPLSSRTPMRHATSSSSLAHGPREPVHMSTTNLGALLDRQRGRPIVIDSTELTASVSSPAASTVVPPQQPSIEPEAGADAVIPMGTPSFSSPLPKSFQPKVAGPRRKEDEHALAAPADESTRVMARSSSAVAVVSPMLQRSPPSILSRHAAAVEPSGFAAFISSPSVAASLRASSSSHDLEASGSPRARSISPHQRVRVSQLSSAGATAPSAESSVHVPLTSSASSGRLVPVSSTMLSSFVSARDRADAADHAALLHSFSRILSPHELHTVAEQAPRLQLQGIVTHAADPHAKADAAAASSTRRSHVSPERRLVSTARPSLTGIVSDAPSAASSGSSTARATGRRKQQASGKPSAAAQHLNNMLRVRAPSVVSQSLTRSDDAAAAAHPSAASDREPALHGGLAAYLASLHAPPPPPTKPASTAPVNALTSPRTQRHKQ